jgi:hypothetical protein
MPQVVANTSRLNALIHRLDAGIRLHSGMRWEETMFKYAALLGILVLPTLATANELDVLSEEALEAAFQAAAQEFGTSKPAAIIAAEMPEAVLEPEIAPTHVIKAPKAAPAQDVQVAAVPKDKMDLRPHSAGITMIEDDPMRMMPAQSIATPEVELAALRIAVNMEETTLQNAIESIVSHASDKVGQWDVRWRLQPENNYLLDEKMNVTAETTLGQFMEFMADRVNNMTGVELFVSVFDVSRLIVISDTYY